MIHAIDTIMLAAALFGPALMIIRWRSWGWLAGTIWMWLMLIAAGKVLFYLDPMREGALLDSVWLLFGWLASAIYCYILLLICELLRKIIKQLQERS